jgi:hypothetical protein
MMIGCYKGHAVVKVYEGDTALMERLTRKLPVDTWLREIPAPVIVEICGTDSPAPVIEEDTAAVTAEDADTTAEDTNTAGVYWPPSKASKKNKHTGGK